MRRDQLFSGAPELLLIPEPGEVRVDDEALHSPIEGYVLDDMPAELRGIVTAQALDYEQLAERQADILDEALPAIDANEDPEVAKITQLDLLFMLGGYVPAVEAGQDMFQLAPPALLDTIQRQTERFPGLKKYMTYDMLVDLNAEVYDRTGNMRVYADGEDGRHERDFYLAHHLAEPHILRAAQSIHALAERPDVANPSDFLDHAGSEIDEFRGYMHAFQGLPVSSFRYFRQFLNTYGDGTRNASGAFMPSVQLLELGLHAPTAMYGVYLDEAEPYFSDWAQPEIREWRAQSQAGVNIEDRLRSGALNLDQDGRKSLDGIVDSFIRFRREHLGQTVRQIPEAFSSLDDISPANVAAMQAELQILEADVPGTGGFDVHNVLLNSIHRLMALQIRLRLMAAEEAS